MFAIRPRKSLGRNLEGEVMLGLNYTNELSFVKNLRVLGFKFYYITKKFLIKFSSFVKFHSWLRWMRTDIPFTRHKRIELKGGGMWEIYLMLHSNCKRLSKWCFEKCNMNLKLNFFITFLFIRKQQHNKRPFSEKNFIFFISYLDLEYNKIKL